MVTMMNDDGSELADARFAGKIDEKRFQLFPRISQEGYY